MAFLRWNTPALSDYSHKSALVRKCIEILVFWELQTPKIGFEVYIPYKGTRKYDKMTFS